MATFSNPNYFLANIQSIVGTYDPGDIPAQMLDFFDPVFTDLMNNISNPYVFEVDGAISLPIVSYRFYGTTSLWWLIAMYNGLLYPTDVEAGNVLYIPKIENVEYILEARKRLNQKTIDVQVNTVII